MILRGLLEGLGLGQQMIIAATVFIMVLYLFKGKKAAGTVVGIASTAWLAAVSIGISVALAIAFGWVDPNPAAFIADVFAFVRDLLSFGQDVVADGIRHFLN